MVVIGTSFIGMEVAAYLSNKAAIVECIGVSAVPFENVLGTRIGKALQQVTKYYHACTHSMKFIESLLHIRIVL